MTDSQPEGRDLRAEPSERRMPIQQVTKVTWELGLKIWAGYAALGHGNQSAERIAERGGFGFDEAACLLKRHHPQAEHSRCREEFARELVRDVSAQAREAGRRERDAQTVAWLGEQVRKMVAEAVTRNECDDQAAWACAASEAIWRAIERGDHLRRGE